MFMERGTVVKLCCSLNDWVTISNRGRNNSNGEPKTKMKKKMRIS